MLQDHVQAHMWFNLAAAQGDTIAVKSLDLATSQMSPNQLAEARRMAREWKRCGSLFSSKCAVEKMPSTGRSRNGDRSGYDRRNIAGMV